MNTGIQKALAGLCLLFSTAALADDCVVLLHGLAKSERDMRTLERSLADARFKTVNYDYSSRDYPIETLAVRVIDAARQQCGTHDKLHFVTHSMGGILVRYYLEHNSVDNLGRVVMLGPPNQGSEVVDAYRNVPGFELIGGPAGLQLGTGVKSVPAQLAPVRFDLGVIAGTRSVNLILSGILPGRDDGKVTVDSTRVEGMRDHIAMKVTHPFMMKNRKVIQQVVHYLKKGAFDRSSTL